MKYVLVLGIEFKKPSKNFKPTNINVSINKRLIDSFSLSDSKGLTDNMISSIDDTWYRHFDKMHWLERNDRKERWKRQPKFYKIYLLEGKELTGNLEIDVDNENSDYTNGFMKKSSILKFHMIGLAPVDLFKDNGKPMMSIVSKLDTGYNTFLSRRNIFPDPWVEVHEEEKKLIRDPISWPCVNLFYIKHREQDEFQTSRTSNPFSDVGGSFTIEIPIKVKHKIKYLGTVTPKHGFPIFPGAFVLATYRPILNILTKYLQ